MVEGNDRLRRNFSFDTKYDVSMEGIQLTLKSDFKCKESKLKSKVSLRRIRERVRDNCILNSY